MDSLNLEPNQLEKIKGYWHEGKLSTKEARQKIYTSYKYMQLGCIDNYGRKK